MTPSGPGTIVVSGGGTSLSAASSSASCASIVAHSGSPAWFTSSYGSVWRSYSSCSSVAYSTYLYRSVASATYGGGWMLIMSFQQLGPAPLTQFSIRAASRTFATEPSTSGA